MTKPKAKEKKVKFPETVFVVQEQDRGGSKYFMLYEDFADIGENDLVAVYEIIEVKRHNVVHSLE